MQANKESATAEWVAGMRALAHYGYTNLKSFSDPTAKVLLTAGGRRRLRRARLAAFFFGSSRVYREVGRQPDLFALRTREIDDALARRALSSPGVQLVILGAGMDGRAFRMKALANVEVYEIDHPATQAEKRERARRLRTVSRSHRYVPVDFEKDALGDALAQAGHDASRTTLWLWEGVIQYLTDMALRTTLDTIALRSTSDSALVATYMSRVEGDEQAVAKLLAGVAREGEPLVGLRSAATMCAEVERVGFVIDRDEDAQAWAARHQVPPLPIMMTMERMLVAVRR